MSDRFLGHLKPVPVEPHLIAEDVVDDPVDSLPPVARHQAEIALAERDRQFAAAVHIAARLGDDAADDGRDR